VIILTIPPMLITPVIGITVVTFVAEIELPIAAVAA